MAGSRKSANAAPPSLQKTSSSSQLGKNQSSIAKFFQKKSAAEPALPINGFSKGTAVKASPDAPKSTSSLTPAPSSDAPEYEDETPAVKKADSPMVNGLPSPVTPAGTLVKNEQWNGQDATKGFYSPSRKVGLLSANQHVDRSS